MKEFADVAYIEKAIKEIEDRENHMVDAFVYAMIGTHYARVEKAIKEILATKVFPPIKKPYGKFWMKIMLWVRGVKILRQENKRYDTTIIVKQFGYVVAQERVIFSKHFKKVQGL